MQELRLTQLDQVTINLTALNQKAANELKEQDGENQNLAGHCNVSHKQATLLGPVAIPCIKHRSHPCINSNQVRHLQAKHIEMLQPKSR